MVCDQANVHDGLRLAYLTPLKEQLNVKIDMVDVEEEILKWKNAVVGLVLGSAPSYQIVRKFAESKWQQFDKVNCTLLKYGLFIFHFESEDAKIRCWVKLRGHL